MELVLTFANTNHVIYAERVLLGAGLDVQVMPLPAAIRAGCGLCLRIGQDAFARAKAALSAAEIPLERVYARAAHEALTAWEGD